MRIYCQPFDCNVKHRWLCLLFPVSLDELAKQSDFLAVCCALTPETKEICNKNLFSKMKNTSIFVNTSRYPHSKYYRAVPNTILGASKLQWDLEVKF